MLASLVGRHPVLTLLPASSAFTLIGLSLRPAFTSLIFLLTSLLLYTRKSALGRYAAPKILSLWIVLSASIAISHLQPSLSALSTPSISIVSLSLLSALSSAVALIPIVGRNFIKPKGARAQMFVFPVLWTFTWLFVSRISPLGRLVTWTPLSGVSSYQWLRSFLGFPGIDFVTAMWASVAAEGLGNIIAENEDEVPLINFEEDDQDPPSSVRRTSGHLVPSIVLLLTLTLPSFYVNTLPYPPFSDNTNPLKVACILPSRSKAPEADQLTRFLAETTPYESLAKIIIWPESAVTFDTQSAKDTAFEQIQDRAAHAHTWIGVSFDEIISNGNPSEYGKRRNGFVLIGPNGPEKPYYKRNLVPIAESFSYVSGQEDPKVLNIPVPIGKSQKGMPPWNISIAASICLDFSAPLTSLTSRPALILAPAKTWHIGVGHAMYELARARAEEIGAEILWCDGGVEGLSGVAGDVQVGEGSWVKTIGIPSPEDDRRTVYGVCGDWLPLGLVVVGLLGSLCIGRDGRRDIHELPGSVIAWSKPHLAGIAARARSITGRNQRAVAAEDPPLLVNTSD